MNRYRVDIGDKAYLVREYRKLWSYQAIGADSPAIKIDKEKYPKLDDVESYIKKVND